VPEVAHSSCGAYDGGARNVDAERESAMPECEDVWRHVRDGAEA
jgi:hypothetical protein